MQTVLTLGLLSTLLLASVVPTGSPAQWANAPAPVEEAQGGGEQPAEQAAPPTVIEQERALQIVSGLGVVSDGYVLKEAKLEQYPALFTLNGYRQLDPFHPGPTYWVIRYVSETSTGVEYRVQLNAETGKLLSFYRENPNRQLMYNPAVSYEEAKAIAEEFVQRLNADIYGQLRYDDSREDTFTSPRPGTVLESYWISFNRIANGIPYPQNNVNVMIDGDGNIISYNYNWNDSVSFEDPAAAMDMRQAEQAYRDRMTLMYLVPFDRPINARAVYEFFPHDLLEASTGRFLDANQMPQPSVGAEPVGNEPLAEHPVTPRELLSREEAAELAVTMMGLPADSRLQQADVVLNLWQLRFETGTAGNQGSALVVLNRSTGLPVSYYHNRAANNQDTPLPEDDIREAAERFLTRVMPYAVTELYPLQDEAELEGMSANDGPMYLKYRQIRDGVWLGDVRVGVNRRSGQVVEFHGNMQLSVEVPPARFADPIPPQQAQDAVFARNQLELVYVSPNDPMSFYGDYDQVLEQVKAADPSHVHAKLVYRWKFYLYYDNAAVDAATGAWVDRRYGVKLP